MPRVVIADAVRTPFGRPGGAMGAADPADLAAAVLRAVVERCGIAPTAVGHVVGGCIVGPGHQSATLLRSARLLAGFVEEVPNTTIDAGTDPSELPFTVAAGLVGSGAIDIAIACGVESINPDVAWAFADAPAPLAPPSYIGPYGRFVEKMGSSDRAARKWGITGADSREYDLKSRRRRDRAVAEGRFVSQIVHVNIAAGRAGSPVVVDRDEEFAAAPAAPVVPSADGSEEMGAPWSCQVGGGASAVLLTTPERAAQLGLRLRARVVDSVKVECAPMMPLIGPVLATGMVLDRNRLQIDDIDVVEINEPFASVVLAWQQATHAEPERVNTTGGVLATGHPLGVTGCALITKAVHGLGRAAGRRGLVILCCGAGLGTGTLLERV